MDVDEREQLAGEPVDEQQCYGPASWPCAPELVNAKMRVIGPYRPGADRKAGLQPAPPGDTQPSALARDKLGSHPLPTGHSITGPSPKQTPRKRRAVRRKNLTVPSSNPRS